MTLVVHCVAGLETESGGPARTVTGLTDSLAREDVVSIILLTQRRTGAAIVDAASASKVDRRITDCDSKLALRAGLPLKKLLNYVIQSQRTALLHDHGIWLPSNHYVAAAARHNNIPLVIHPRGMLEPWALQHRSWKKRLALRLYQRRDLETAALFFATGEQEANNIRRLKLRQPIAVIPNGVDMVQSLELEPKSVQQDSRTALFIGRIHPIKGLPNLIEAWGRVRPPNWRLCISGPDEGGHLAEVLEKVRLLGLSESVDYVGKVEGDAKRALFEKADLFVLPSFSENFGLVVVEALAHGVPVITTQGTPWEELPRYGCGWYTAPITDDLTETLHQAMGMDPASLVSMGENGRAYAQKFNWKTIAQRTLEVYGWVLGEGPMPDCVITD